MIEVISLKEKKFCALSTAKGMELNMDIKRLIRISKRLNDLLYIKYGIKYIEDKLFIKHYLPILAKYHTGLKYDFQSINQRRLIRIMEYAYQHSSYYSRLFDESSVNTNELLLNWDNVPFLDKDIIRKEKENILALPRSKDYIGFVTTGGSTGQPLGFHTLGGCDAEHQEFLFRIIGYKPGDKILAMDGTVIPNDLLGENIFWVTKNESNLPYGSMALSSQYLSSVNIQHYVNFLNDFKPNIIRGYPSFISDIANYILRNNIKIAFEVKGVELTSESFYEYQIVNIRKAFNTRVFNQYGHAEASVFGYSIDASLLTYCSPLYGYTEVIGVDNKHVESGEIGEIVVTGFTNYAMPFIRYRTGDLALYDGEENGIVRLKQIYGRTQDYIYSKNMEKILLTAIIFARHYKAFANINRWQIIQNTPGKITFLIVKLPSFSIEDQNELSNNFQRIANIKSEFEYVDKIPLTPRGKSKFLIQNIVVKG